MRSGDWSRLLSVAIITTFLTLGLLLPIWLIVFLVLAITNKSTPKHTTPIQRSEPKTIYPSNDFAGDWEFKMYEIESN